MIPLRLSSDHKLLIILFFIFLSVSVFYLGIKYHSFMTTPPSSSSSALDERDCIPGAVSNTFDEKFLIGKTFMNSAVSGEWGVFADDHRLLVNWGRDYAGPNDDRPNSGIGGWYISNNDSEPRLFLYGTTISDDLYTDFRFFKYKENIFVVPWKNMGLIIGPDTAAVDEFYTDVVRPCR